MSLINAIQNGESKNLEFKVELPSSQALAKTIIAFSNTGGGKLIIGINDKGKVIGLNPKANIFELQDKVASIIYETCYPNILPELYTTTINDILVLVIEVNRGNLLPYYLKHQGKHEGVYIRVGATNRKASYDNILELERQRLNKSYDQEVNREISFDTIDLTPLTNRFASLNKPFDHTVLKNLKLIHEENGIIYPTNGLLILLGHFEHVRIKCSRFKGKTMDIFLDRKEYDGDLFTQIDHADNFIKNYISLSSKINGLQRIDEYEIPPEAIRESLVNAVIHRDYTNDGRDIKVGVYDDMLNVVSPGGFPSTITQADILEGRSEIRNKVIARVFKELNYIEQWGSGIRRIKSSCINKGLKEPQILEKGDFVDVSLFRSYILPQVNDEGEIFYSNHEKEIVKYLTGIENKISTKNASEILNLSDRAARTILTKMVEKRILERLGSGPQTHYKLLS